MSPRFDSDVLIVGAGPTGMVAALSLAQHGIRSIVVDRRTAIATHPKAHELSSRSLEILIDLGVPFAELDASASPYEDSTRVVFCGTLERVLGRLDLRDDGADAKYFAATRTPKPFLNLSQTALERVLESEVRARPGIDLRLGVRWESMTEHGDATHSIVRGDDGTTTTLTTRYLLCADGANSRCRGAFGIEMVGPESIQEFVNAYFEHDLSAHVPERAKLYFSFDPRCPGSFVAHDVEKRWVYHAPIYRPDDRPADFDADEMEGRIATALGARVPGLRVRSIELWNMTAQVASRFRHGRAFLLGDAAHRFPPTGGLGMNSGIADAHNLSWKLAMVMRANASDTLLDTYEAERRPVVERNCKESTTNYERMFEIVEALGLSPAAFETSMRLRARLSRFVPRFLIAMLTLILAGLASFRTRMVLATARGRAELARAVRRQRAHFDRIGLDLGARYEEGAVLLESVRDASLDDPCTYVESTRAGSRFPHFWLDRGRNVSSHSFIDPRRFTLLVGTRGARWVKAIPKDLVELDVVRIEQVDPEEHPRLDIGKSGAILLRPDGYVAFRASELTVDYPRRVRALLRAVGLGQWAARPSIVAPMRAEGMHS